MDVVQSLSLSLSLSVHGPWDQIRYKCSNQKHGQHEGTNATAQQSRPESRRALAVKTIMVSPMQDIPPSTMSCGQHP